MPNPKDLSFKAWDAENSMVMSWLINTTEPDVNQGYVFFSTAKEI